MKQITLVFFIIFPFFIAGQTIKLDSLKYKLSQQNNNINKIKLLILISEEYKTYDLNESLKLANEVFELSKKENYNEGIANGLLLIANIQTNNGLNDKATLNIEKAEKFISTKLLQIKLNRCKGSLKVRENDYSKALEYYFKALTISNEINNELEKAMSLNSIGMTYIQTIDFLKAIDYFNKSLEISLIKK